MTVAEKIEVAQASQFLAANAAAKGLYKDGNSGILSRLIYMIRKNVERLYNLSPSNPTLTKTSNYMYSLCAPFSLKAQSILGGGGSVAPIAPPSQSLIFPLVVTGADFEADGVTYNNSDIVGENLMLFVATFNQEWQFAPAFFSYTPTGIQIVFPGFDANNYDYIIIQNFNP